MIQQVAEPSPRLGCVQQPVAAVEETLREFLLATEEASLTQTQLGWCAEFSFHAADQGLGSGGHPGEVRSANFRGAVPTLKVAKVHGTWPQRNSSHADLPTQ